MGSLQRAVVAGALLFSLAHVASCGGSALGETPTISGHVDNWKSGQQTLVAAFYGGSNSGVGASSTINADGNFSITLPGASDVTPHLQIQVVGTPQLPTGCTGTQQWDPSNYGMAEVIFLVTNDTKNNSALFQLNKTGSSSTLVAYVYIDRDWNASVEIDCKNSRGGADHTSNQLHFKAGWNRKILNFTELANAQINKIYTGDVPEGVGWTTNQ